MSTIEKAVQNFMENQLGIYVNLRDVEITTGLDFSICVTIDLEEESNEEMSVGLLYFGDTLREFIKTFKMKSITQFKTIALKDLLELYHQGNAYMYCIIDGYDSFSLYFLKQGEKHIAKTEEDKIHEVIDLLETPQQLVKYTREQFQAIKESTALQQYQHTLANGKNDKDMPGQVGLSFG